MKSKKETLGDVDLSDKKLKMMGEDEREALLFDKGLEPSVLILTTLPRGGVLYTEQCNKKSSANVYGKNSYILWPVFQKLLYTSYCYT